jgi:hypothetical protein
MSHEDGLRKLGFCSKQWVFRNARFAGASDDAPPEVVG